ncbi:MAG TPA: tetratricopeptide repeat protein [Thermoleophilaceae bacterium]|nr:tetratricopeptide repeat protein [Thermoleophilaceae bacterium]
MPPRLFLNHIPSLDWLICLEFGRVDDGQPSENWEGVSDQVGFLRDGPDGRHLGFKAVDYSTLDLFTEEHAPLWLEPHFACPALGLPKASAAEIILGARALLGRRPTINRVYFSAAIDEENPERAFDLWLSCLTAGDAMAHFALGYTLYELGRHHEAYRHLRHYTEIAPNGPWNWCWYGKAAEALGELTEARAAYRRAIELEEEHGEETDARELLDALEGERSSGGG